MCKQGEGSDQRNIVKKPGPFVGKTRFGIHKVFKTFKGRYFHQYGIRHEKQSKYNNKGIKPPGEGSKSGLHSIGTETIGDFEHPMQGCKDDNNKGHHGMKHCKHFSPENTNQELRSCSKNKLITKPDKTIEP